MLALPSATAAALLDDLAGDGALLDALSTVLLVGAPDTREHDDVLRRLQAAGERRRGAPRARARRAPAGLGRCRPSVGGADPGLHTSPDLELLHVVDPETGEPSGGPGELVVTQLGLRGSALVRWRTGDLVEGLDERPCPACGRRLPRVLGLRRGALVPEVDLPDGPARVDLRAVAGVLAGRPDLDDWRVECRASARDGRRSCSSTSHPCRRRSPPGSPARSRGTCWRERGRR